MTTIVRDGAVDLSRFKSYYPTTTQATFTARPSLMVSWERYTHLLKVHEQGRPEPVRIIGFRYVDGEIKMYSVRARDSCEFYCAPWELSAK